MMLFLFRSWIAGHALIAAGVRVNANPVSRWAEGVLDGIEVRSSSLRAACIRSLSKASGEGPGYDLQIFVEENILEMGTA